MLATAGALVAGMASCKKEPMPKEAITQTINVGLKSNENYTFTLPKNQEDDPYEITSQAKHFGISEVGVNTSGERVFNYTPSKDYIGSDQVIISNDREKTCQQMHPGGPQPLGPPPCGHQKGNCKGGEEDHYIITINFVMQSNSEIAITK